MIEVGNKGALTIYMPLIDRVALEMEVHDRGAINRGALMIDVLLIEVPS